MWEYLSTEKIEDYSSSVELSELASQISLDESIAPVGQSVTDIAEKLGYEDPLVLAMMMLLKPTDIPLMDPKSGTETWVKFLPGHTVQGNWGPDRNSKVMVIGKMPWVNESRKRRLFVGPSGEAWKSALTNMGVDYSSWYLTNVVRFCPPGKKKSLLSHWLKECRWLLDQEIHLMKPDYILLFGGDAIKALMGPLLPLR